MNHNTKPLFFILALLALLALACSLTGPTAASMSAALTPTTPTKSPTAALQAPTAAMQAPTAAQCVVTAQNLHLRAAAGTDAPVIGYLAAGDTLTPNGARLGDWQQVTTQGGRSGWVNALYTTCEAPK